MLIKKNLSNGREVIYALFKPAHVSTKKLLYRMQFCAPQISY